MTSMRHRRGFSGLAPLAFAVALAASPSAAQEEKFPPPGERSAEWELAFGGKLYDNMFAATYRLAPDRLHPLMPPEADAAPVMSWRCVTCHGFDYRGGPLSRGTARPPLSVPGLGRVRGTGPSAIATYLRRPPHGYAPQILSDAAMGLLARFVSAGQHDPEDYFAHADEADSGRPIFQGVCISCHEADGRAYIEGEPGDKPSLGWLARNRPAQVLHKIRNGFPGTDMVSLRFLGPEQIGPLLAYLKTLPDPE
jgi:thiosulfate dehydrogenase